MGKDWYWSGKSTSKRTSLLGGTKHVQTDNIPSGCMCAIFQSFDFHPFHFSLNQQHQSLSPIHTLPKRAEAPRNSLESEDSLSSSISKEQHFKIPKNIRTKTSESARTKGECFNDLFSPGTKTPTLVARLMGLDLLPDTNSSTSTSSSSSLISTPNKQGHCIKIMKHRHSTDSVIMRSETPRLSSERRLDVEHRLSLQINKENEDLDTPRFSFSKSKFFDENSNNSCTSPSHYARQIVKQVKESVSRRKVGVDITNTIQNREQEKQDFVAQIKLKKVLKPLDESNQGKHSTNTSHSPRLSRFSDTNHNKHSPPNPINTLKQSSPPLSLVNIEAQVSRGSSTKPKTQAMSEKEMMQDKKFFPECKKTAHGNLSPRIRNKTPQTSIRNKQEESFIILPSSSTTKANDIKTKIKRNHPLSNNSFDTKIPQKQVNDDVQEAKNISKLFSCSRQRYKQESTHTLAGATISATCANTEESEYEYITTILSRVGINRATVTNFNNFQWFSSTHPLDPSIFHRLEHYPTSNSFVSIPQNHKDSNFTQKNQLGPRCNRRLLFDLVDEVLSEILVSPKGYRGLMLLETVWKKIQNFLRAKCEDLEDIDGLIEMKEVMDTVKEEEEGEKLVGDIEGKVLEMLMNETITVIAGDVG